MFSAKDQPTRVFDRILGEGLNWGSLIAGRIDEAVIQDLDIPIILRQQGDLIGHRLGIRKGGHILPHSRKAQHDMLARASGQLGLALLAQHDEIGVGGLLHHPAGLLGEARVDTAAQALVGGADDDERLFGAVLGVGVGLGLLEDGVGGLAVGAGFGHGALGAGEFGGGDDFHRLGDLFDVADGFETAFDLSEGGIGGGGDEDGSVKGEGSVSFGHAMSGLLCHWCHGAVI